MIATYRDKRIESARGCRSRPAGGAACRCVLADNRYPEFRAADLRGGARRATFPRVLDADRPTPQDDPLLTLSTHVVFSAERRARRPARTISPPR